MADRFYTNSPLQLGDFQLLGPEAHHLAAVCRHQVGDLVSLFNGDGAEYHATILGVSKKSVSLVIDAIETPLREVRRPVWVAAPLPKGDRADFLIEKLTEQGVTDFVPLRTARSIVEPREQKLDRLRRHSIEACKQCGRNRLMTIHELTDWATFVRLSSLPDLRMIAHPYGDRLMQLAEVSEIEWLSGAVIALGPEGGFTEPEATEALAAQWRGVSLGPRIQRIETAALTVAAWLTQLADQ
ncbi:RsmE family RNA methyltransferase [Tuwongella immobilis]|uniref:Ribosomal RNA small subunit methyltransferase E n=1 Tax=Tuwongella immobilis TaxID=692036 RepID=A0A6C2YKB6_9BACT|nr:RsmE family RNA methyltransferase [Tuwongella immobilis]VIP02018.1 16s rrna methyltransferase : Ribosomal RNA small subunit methyltransferase E OS=Blastopirellula marina DSM 3645 GN=DSM3645_10607 PE=3 SV=1: Methyltrans_RNA [Tuwongella immobilis]VTS00141.1 16s rrna methyltransferase : Ribosomal RNA small subunit methyltransferase E OS=Blastopirellula marina DSM 3645 GN=DSM3645_10607 PE=3 SV=1: Methyltrans_RNA [Tuwongella immobilis]